MVVVSKNLQTAKSFDPWSGRRKTYRKTREFEGSFVSCSVGCVVYIFGDDRTAFALDTVANSWREMSRMSVDRTDPGVAACGGMVYVTGGVVMATGKGVRTAERFDPERNFWEKMPSMKKPRSRHCLVASRGFVYAIGGLNNNNAPVKLVERISPKQGVWMNAAPMKKSRSSALCVVKDESVFVLGGTFVPDDSVEMLNASGSGWTTITVSIPKNCLAACAVGDDVFVVCGADSGNEKDLEIREFRLDGEKSNWVENIADLGHFGGLAVAVSCA